MIHVVFFHRKEEEITSQMNSNTKTNQKKKECDTFLFIYLHKGIRGKQFVS